MNTIDLSAESLEIATELQQTTISESSKTKTDFMADVIATVLYHSLVRS
jgi:hypothetical protein